MMLSDPAAALALHERAITLYEGLANRGRTRKYEESLALCYVKKAVLTLATGGDPTLTGGWFDQAITVLERMVIGEGRAEHAAELVICYTQKAVALAYLEDFVGCLAAYDRAIALLERLVLRDGYWSLAHLLPDCYRKKACAVAIHLGDARGSLALNDKAARMLERLLAREWSPSWGEQLAESYCEKAVDASVCGDLPTAMEAYGEAARAYRRLAEAGGGADTIREWAKCLTDQTQLARRVGRLDEADRSLAEAAQAYEELGHDGRDEVEPFLADCYLERAAVFEQQGRGAAEVLGLYDRADEMLERLVAGGRGDLAGKLAACRDRRDTAARLLAQTEETELDRRIAAYERQVHMERRMDVFLALARCYLERLEQWTRQAPSDQGRQRDELRRALSACNDLGDAAIFAGRNDLFEQLGPLQQDLRRRLRAIDLR
jgi:tetratricopeptide (TPR) repeat protein